MFHERFFALEPEATGAIGGARSGPTAALAAADEMGLTWSEAG